MSNQVQTRSPGVLRCNAARQLQYYFLNHVSVSPSERAFTHLVVGKIISAMALWQMETESIGQKRIDND
jgi:hypothetical protein